VASAGPARANKKALRGRLGYTIRSLKGGRKKETDASDLGAPQKFVTQALHGRNRRTQIIESRDRYSGSAGSFVDGRLTRTLHQKINCAWPNWGKTASTVLFPTMLRTIGQQRDVLLHGQNGHPSVLSRWSGLARDGEKRIRL